MRYMFLIYTREGEASTAEMERTKNEHWAAIDEAMKKGILHAAQPLKSTASATTVRMQGNKPLVIDGPFAETKEQLAGYYIIDCKDLDEAITWAAKIPSACGGGEGCIEIRPFDELPARG
jgi:hypothetical protein